MPVTGTGSSDSSAAGGTDSESSSSLASSSSSSERPLPVTTLAQTATPDHPSNIAPTFLVAKHPEIQNVDELENRLKVVVTEEGGTQLEVERTVETTAGGYSVTLTPPGSFHPGVYRLQALLQSSRGATRALQRFYRQVSGGKDDGDLTLLSTDIHWGDVAVNTDVSAYRPGDEAAIHIAVLDDDDTPKCLPAEALAKAGNPDLTLTVTDPGGHEHAYTLGHGIEGPACPLSGTGSAESTVKFALPRAGTYQLALAYPGLGTGQTVARSTLRVSEEQPLLRISRDSVTQTAPGRIEMMTITVTAAQTFRGTFTDTVPDGFTVVHVSDVGSSAQTGDATTVSWDREFQAGQPVSLSYLYRVGDDVPVLGLFGPLTAKGTVDRSAAVQNPVSSSSLSSESSATSDASSSSPQSAQSGVGSESSPAQADASPRSSSVSSDASAASAFTSASLSSSASQPPENTGGTASPAARAAPVPSASPDSSESSTSPLSWLFTWFAPRANGQEDSGQVSSSDARLWQVLATLPPQSAPGTAKRANRTLLLVRKQAAFTALESPSFTLVDAHFDTGAVLDREGHLKTEVAVRELLHAVISEQDVQQSLVKEVVRENAQMIGQTVAQSTDATAGEVIDALTAAGSAQEEVARTLTDKRNVQTAVAAIDTAATEDKIVDAIIAASGDHAQLTGGGSGTGAVQQAISQAVAEKPRVTQRLEDSVTQAISTSQDAAQAVADAVSGAEGDSTSSVLAPAPSGSALMHLTLIGPHGEVIQNPRFHFEVGSVVLAIDPLPSFTPGLYTLEFTVTNPLSGQQQKLTQQFVWGVLAMNTDQDHYAPGETAHIAFGVLDDRGEIVCDAGLSLEVVGPDGTSRTLSTANKSISTTGTCGKKQAGFIGPDYEVWLPLPQEGGYRLTLTATTKNGTRSIAMTLPANGNSAITVTRAAATRLWPFAPSPMDIRVEVSEDIVDGTIIDTLPPGFVVSDASPSATVQEEADGTTTVTWRGDWRPGQAIDLHYLYDAPDISPQFYLIGPLRIEGNRPLSP
jgi:hypothetical protein